MSDNPNRTLTLYMRSGNKIVLPGIVDWKIEGQQGKIEFIKIEYVRQLGDECLIMSSLDLNQIEAITETQL